MLHLFRYWFTVCLLLATTALFAQDSTVAQVDTAHVDSLAHVQDLLQQQVLQQKLDSTIQAQLQAKLDQMMGDDKRKQELEQQLRDMQVSDSLKRVAQMEKLQKLKQTTNGFPVSPFGDTLFVVYTKLGSFTAKDRATAIADRLVKLYKAPSFQPDSLKVIAFENGYDIVYGTEMQLMSITNIDALWLDTDNQELADTYASAMRTAVVNERDANSVTNWLKRIGLVALIILVVVIIILLINRLFRLSAVWLNKHKETYLHGITIRNFQLFSPVQHLKAALFLNNVLRIILIIFALYLSLPLLFSVFPDTEEYTNTLINWVLTPARSIVAGVLGFLPDLFTIIVIYLAFRYALKMVAYLFSEIEHGRLTIDGFYPDWAKPTLTIIKVILYAFMMVVIFPYLPGSDSPAFQGISVFLGVLLSLGSSSAITNLIAGIVITYMRPFKLGDRIKIGDVTGDVIEKNMLVTRIRNIKNEAITVPNSTVLSSHTINYSANSQSLGLIVHTTVTIGYDVPWRDVHQALIEAALATDMVLKEPQPFVLQTSLDDFYISYQLNAYTREPNKQAIIYSAMHQNIQDKCAAMGIEIMSPHYRAQRDGSESTIPKDKA